jgi:hypothetical protein
MDLLILMMHKIINKDLIFRACSAREERLPRQLLLYTSFLNSTTVRQNHVAITNPKISDYSVMKYAYKYASWKHNQSRHHVNNKVLAKIYQSTYGKIIYSINNIPLYTVFDGSCTYNTEAYDSVNGEDSFVQAIIANMPLPIKHGEQSIKFNSTIALIHEVAGTPELADEFINNTLHLDNDNYIDITKLLVLWQVNYPKRRIYLGENRSKIYEELISLKKSDVVF